MRSLHQRFEKFLRTKGWIRLGNKSSFEGVFKYSKSGSSSTKLLRRRKAIRFSSLDSCHSWSWATIGAVFSQAGATQRISHKRSRYSWEILGQSVVFHVENPGMFSVLTCKGLLERKTVLVLNKTLVDDSLIVTRPVMTRNRWVITKTQQCVVWGDSCSEKMGDHFL